MLTFRSMLRSLAKQEIEFHLTHEKWQSLAGMSRVSWERLPRSNVSNSNLNPEKHSAPTNDLENLKQCWVSFMFTRLAGWPVCDFIFSSASIHIKIDTFQTRRAQRAYWCFVIKSGGLDVIATHALESSTTSGRARSVYVTTRSFFLRNKTKTFLNEKKRARSRKSKNNFNLKYFQIAIARRERGAQLIIAKCLGSCIISTMMRCCAWNLYFRPFWRTHIVCVFITNMCYLQTGAARHPFCRFHYVFTRPRASARLENKEKRFYGFNEKLLTWVL